MKKDKEYTYFGLEVITEDGICKNKGVREKDIKKLPFYEFWEEKSKGSTVGILEDGSYFIYIGDWEKFCHKFINTGK